MAEGGEKQVRAILHTKNTPKKMTSGAAWDRAARCNRSVMQQNVKRERVGGWVTTRVCVCVCTVSVCADKCVSESITQLIHVTNNQRGEKKNRKSQKEERDGFMRLTNDLPAARHTHSRHLFFFSVSNLAPCFTSHAAPCSK